MDVTELSIEDLKTFIRRAEQNAAKLKLSTTRVGSATLGWLNLEERSPESLERIRNHLLREAPELRLVKDEG